MNYQFSAKDFILPIILLLALAILILIPATDTLEKNTEIINNRISDNHITFNQLINDTTFLKEFKKGLTDNFQWSKLEKKNMSLAIIENNKFTHWTPGIPISNESEIQFVSHDTIQHFKTGWYHVLYKADSTMQTVIIGFYLIKHDFPIVNKFLRNTFWDPSISENYSISFTHIPNSKLIISKDSRPLVYIYKDDAQQKQTPNKILTFVSLVFLLGLLYYINQTTEYIRYKFNSFYSLLYLSSILLILRYVMLTFQIPGEWMKLDLFNPMYYAASFFNPSLGDLLINSICFLWICFRFAEHILQNQLPKNLFPTIGYLLFPNLLAFNILETCRSLIIDSTISFEVYRLLDLNLFSFIGFIILFNFIISHFLISSAVASHINQNESLKNTKTVILIQLFFSVMIVISGYFYQVWSSALVLAFWNFGIVVLLLNSKNFRIPNLHVYQGIILIGFYSILIMYFIENLYETKERQERKSFILKLIDQRDYLSESSFINTAPSLKQDVYIKNIFKNPIRSESALEERISNLYLGPGFNNYEISVDAFSATGIHIFEGYQLSTDSLYNLLRSNYTLIDSSFFFKTDSTRNYSYYSMFPVTSDSEVIGHILLHFKSKLYGNESIYPELIAGKQLSEYRSGSNYGYAIYFGDKLIYSKGKYNYSYLWPSTFNVKSEEFRFIDIPGWEHLIHEFSGGRKAIVTIEQESIFEPVATISYVFTILLILSIIFTGSILFSKNKNLMFIILESLRFSFRIRIIYSIITIIIISFILIGAVTINYLQNQYNEYYSERLHRKGLEIVSNLESFSYDNLALNSENEIGNHLLDQEFSNKISELSEINQIDVNVYNSEGKLSLSSQSAIFAQGLASKLMHPFAMASLSSGQSNQFIAKEKFGNLDYLSSYSSIRNQKGQIIAFVGIPYFARTQELKQQVSEFLVTLANVYLFLLIVSTIFTFLISNSITQPLRFIGEKMSLINLGGKNTPIDYNSKDEIGKLVSEYNKMIKELEISAESLAKNERESAWREMARQVAHEIKNPLTPMRLNIQYLEKALMEDNPNAKEMSKKISKTLLEQIENLSNIASAFSSFATMPKANNETINISQLISSVKELFDKETTKPILIKNLSEHIEIKADKNQMISVFNNLIKNAIQSITEEKEPEIEVLIFNPNSDYLTVAVKDNGCGISEEARVKVFVPNFTTKSSGTGLGLAITKKIVENAGGEIWFDSEENKGTTFFVKLPLFKI